MRTLEEVRAIFPTANYAPKEGCGKCDGEGTYEKDGRTHPCICIFVGPEFSDEARKMLAEHARNMLNNPQAIKDMADATAKAVQQFKNGKVDDK